MQNGQSQIISKIRKEFDAVKDAYTRLKEEKDELAETLQALNDKVEKQDIALKELEARNENLQIAKAVSVTNYSGSVAEKRIDDLVSEIDKCIALLNR